MCDNVHMISSQRQHLILSRLRTRGAVRITALSKELGVSAMTIRRDIAGILHTLNQAYDTLYDTLLSDVAMDVSSEIAALQGMLASDGLTGGDFQ